ncbi:alpha-galactosidase [Candidatus Sumerlaeota bacterium]|nr:alpha-galactosidase [Candidatus Sumerlaeota bacterium]
MPLPTEETSAVTPLALILPEGALALAVECDGEAGRALFHPGDQRLTVAAPPQGRGALWLSAGDVHGALAAVAEAMMAEVEPRSPMRGPLWGWMSWDELRFGLCERDVLENAEIMARRLGVGDAIVLLDDGWQRAAGDWEPNERFGRGLPWLTDRIHALGLRAGLWIAPFSVAICSEMAHAHGDWLLRSGADGEPLVDLDFPQWGGRTGTLDPTRPEVIDWLHALGQRLAGWGFDYVKMDFLFHALTGVASDPSQSRTAAYRRAIGAIRAGLGSDVITMGCGTPLVPGRGLFDAARIGDDVVTDWSLMRTRMTAAALRHCLHRRWWRCDPDNVVLRDPLTVDQGRAWATTVAMTGGSVFLGDDLRRLDSERWDIARRIWPPVDIDSRPLRLDTSPADAERPIGDGWIAEVHRPWGRCWVAALVNWEATCRVSGVRWSELGISEGTPCHVWELWAERSMGVHRDEITVELSPTSCQVLVITPAADHPQVVGFTRHVLSGAVGLESVRWDASERTLSGTVSRPLPESAPRLAIAVPRGWRLDTPQGLSAESVGETDVAVLTVERVGEWSLSFTACPEEAP